MISEKTKQPWPTKKAMEQVYQQNLWGGVSGSFYSGEGSHSEVIVAPYIKELISFLNSFKTPVSICDLGCGDFNIGKQLLPYVNNYFAVDVVTDLIAYNRKNFINDRLSFFCLDIAKDTLPFADVAIVRQVLQHLSNKEVKRVLLELKKYTYLILTEHIPLGDFTPNVDIISGQGIRLKKKSGLDILAPPFNLDVKSSKVLNSVTLSPQKGKIVTTLYKLH